VTPQTCEVKLAAFFTGPMKEGNPWRDEALLPIRALYKSGRIDELHNWRVKDLKQVAA
jgi:hypothetical protein